MPLPDLTLEGYLPPGIHAASLGEAQKRLGRGSGSRERQIRLLEEIVGAARLYPTIKRILLWGSFVSAKAEPNDLDYSIVVSIDHHRAEVSEPHRRFFIPFDARQYYGVDRGFLIIRDYPLSTYSELLDFICHTRTGNACGIIEISLRGEFIGGSDD